MAAVDGIDAAGSSQIAGSLSAALGDVSQQKTIVFTTYIKTVLPLDGFVFWLRSGQVSASGMLHHSVERDQTEDETVTSGQVVFTTTEPIVALNEISTRVLIVGIVEGERYAFRGHGMYAEQANLWHYIGSTVQASLESQFIDNPTQFDDQQLVVSNSLPVWLALASYNPIWLLPPNPGVVLYPSFLVDDNIPPPFGAVHIGAESTSALQAVPWLRSEPDLPATQTRTRHAQLGMDRVRITLYGLNNDAALDFLDLVLSYSRDTDAIGLMNTPIIRDGKRGWPEGLMIGMQKIVEFEVSYLQQRVVQIAKQLILAASTAVIPTPDS